jgi:hypothetical protein
MIKGKLKAVLGGWDPSDRKFLKTDEITFAVPFEMFKRMVNRGYCPFLLKSKKEAPTRYRARF